MRCAGKPRHVGPEESDRLIRYAPILVRSGTVTDWERQFCASLVARSRKGPPALSVKQAAILRRMVDRLMASDGQTGDVIE